MENYIMEPLVLGELKSYTEVKLKLEKFKAIRKGSPIAASMIICSIAACSLLMGFLFGSTTLAFYLSSLLGSLLAGFGCVAAIFFLVGVILLMSQKGLKTPIVNFIIKKTCN